MPHEPTQFLFPVLGAALIFSPVGAAQKPRAEANDDLELYVLHSHRDPAHAQQESLRGLRAVYVIVEAPLTPEAVADGLTARQLQTDAELQLRRAGIKVPTDDEYGALPRAEQTSLLIEVGIIKSNVAPTYAVSITVSLSQLSRLARNNAVADGVTWTTGSVIIVGAGKLSEVRSDTRDLVDKFANAYLSVNPR